MKQTAATFLVKAPSLNPVSGFDPPHQRHLHLFSTNSGFQSSRHRSGGHLDSRSPVSIQQQCSSNRHKGSCSSSSGGGSSSKGNSSRSKHNLSWRPSQQQLGSRMVHIKRDPGQCMCNRYLRSPGSAPTSHAAIIDLCPLPFPSVTKVIVSSDGSSAIPCHMVYAYQTPRRHAKSVYSIKEYLYTLFNVFKKL